MRVFLICILSLLFGCKTKYEEVTRLPRISTVPFSSGPGIPVRWPIIPLQTTPLKIKISQAIIDEFNPAEDDSEGRTPTEQMANEWDKNLNHIQLFDLPAPLSAVSGYNNLNSYNDSEIGIYKSLDWFSDVSSNALAITQYYGIRKNKGASNEYLELIHADIIVNFRDFEFSDYADSERYDLRSVLLHELGHLIGISHQYNFSVPSVMQPRLHKTDQNRSLTSNDIDSINKNYPLTPASLNAGESSSRTASRSSGNGEIERGVIELMPDGHCRTKLLPVL